MANTWPDMEPISQVFNEFADHHKEFRMPEEPGRTISKRAAEELKEIFYDEDGELLPENTVIKNVQMFAARLAAVVPQIKDNPDWNAKGPATDDEYAESQRTLHKSMQSLFSTPIVRMKYWRDDASVKRNDLSNIVVDPTKITTQMLRNLGLESYIPPKGMRMELRTAHMAQAIPEIKRIIGNLKPFALSGEDARTQKRGFRLYTTPDGYIVGIQSVSGIKVLYRTDIHGARRRIDHIHDNYREEINLLCCIRSIIWKISSDVRDDWEKAKSELPQKQAQMLECVDRLRFVKNDHKIELRDRINRCVSFQTEHKMRDGETQVRFNPGSRLAILTTTANFIGRRLGEIERISGYLEQDRVRIDSCVAEQQEPVEYFFKRVEMQHARFLLLDENRPLSDEKLRQIVGNLGQFREACESPPRRGAKNGISLQPYVGYAHAACEHIDTSIAWLTIGNREKAAASFMRAYVASKIQHCFIDLQAFYKSSLSPDRIPYFLDAIEDLRRIRGELLKKRVAPHIEVKDYNSFVTPVAKLVNDLIALAVPAVSRGGTYEDRKKARDGMRELFHKFDFRLMD